MAVLKNLVNNAIEAIEAGARRGTIQIVEHLKDGQYEFSVSDDGPGISARHLPNIFKMATPPNLIIKQETSSAEWDFTA